MHLKSLEMTGFKSFAEAKVEFPSGITAVVGPNGTGKSNIVDAILWVLGEQSTKTLRSEKMEDVIFNGTEARKPLGMAEVTLILSGVDAHRLHGADRLPHHLGEFHEVMVTRRLYRNGDSEYLINKTLSRLKDVRGLLLDTRAGSKGHTIIEQGRIDHILNASPLERRELIEETAGIVRYKKQKAEALRKLEATQQNLLRVRDIIGEVRRQLNALERQARQARTYRTLQEEARTLEIRLLVHEHRTLSRRQAVIAADLAALDTEESGHVADQARLHGDLEATRMRMLASDGTMQHIREELHTVEHHQAQALTAAEVERGKRDLYEGQRRQAEGELARLAEARMQATATLEQLRGDRAAVEGRLADGERALGDLEVSMQQLEARRQVEAEEVESARQGLLDLTIQQTTGRNLMTAIDERGQEAARRASRLSEEHAELVSQRGQSQARVEELGRARQAGEALVADLRREREAIEQEQGRVERELREVEQQLVRRQEELAAIESSWTALRSVVREEMGYGREGDEESTSVRAACRGVRAALAEWLEVPPGLERALEAVLGERVRAWLVEGPGEAQEAVAFLKSRELGRGAFVPVRARYHDPAAGAEQSGWWPGLRAAEGVVGRASDLVRTSGESPEALQWLLDGVVVVRSLDVALALWQQGSWTAPGGPILVTTDGEVLDQAGVLIGGSSGSSGGLLQRRGEVQRLETQQGELRRVLEAERQAREALARRTESLRGEAGRLDSAIREAELRSLGLSKDQEGVAQQTDALSKRLDLLELERRAAEEELRRIEEESAGARAQLARLEEEQAGKERRFAELTATLQRIDDDSRTLRQRVTEARLEAAAQRARLEHLNGELDRLTQEQADREARSVAVDAQRNALAVSAAQSQAEQERNEVLCRELDQRAGEIRAQLVAAQEAHAQDGERSRGLEQALDGVRALLNELRERRTGFEVQRAEVATQLAGVEQTLTGTYQLSLDDAMTQMSEEMPVASASAGESEGPDAGPAEAQPDPIQALREQLQRIRERLQRMGAINLAAIEEHQELESRHTFLSAQEADLTTSVTSLKEIIQKINRTTKQLFMETFNELQEKFGEVFTRLFPGGRAELVLVEPEPVEGDEQPKARHEEHGVDIVAQPPGKRLKSITMLSGGEKTLTAMALIFASFLIRPTPFCVLDEIDAPLDEENIGRFTAVLKEMAERAQFLVITHNKRTMNVADSLFGVTMEEPGVSKIVSVQIAELQPA